MAAVTDLNLEIGDNQFITLLGPSGCGKTTTLRLIAGYMAPDAGTIHVDGTLMSSKDTLVLPEHRGMGMVFQNYAVWPHKTVYENVVFGLKLRKVPAAKARELVDNALGLVNLSGYENRLPNQLSGGQQQRVALARSLVVEPDILLLDEPLSNLDAKLREHMRSELKHFSAAPASLSSMSHTIRPRLWRCPTRSPSFMPAACSNTVRRARSIRGRPTASSPTSWAT